jgi:hypothetical protein
MLTERGSTPDELAEGQTGLLGNFARHVTVGEDDHWLWQGALNTYGMPKARDGQRTVEVHRRLYELVVGPVPEGKFALTCETPLCVNPFHVKPGTLAEAQTYQKQDRCFRGHDISKPENRIGGTMSGACKACGAVRGRLHRQKMMELRKQNRRGR